MSNTDDSTEATTSNRRYESPLGVKTEVIFIRLTPEEKALLVEQSKIAGISMSAMVRMMLSQYSKKELSFNNPGL